MPFADDCFDVVFSAFGALQFVADAEALVADVARVLRPGGVFAFSVTHPTRWMFPDDPGEEGLVASQSYWDRTPYVEVDDVTGETRYVEHHRTIGDWVAALAAHGFVLTDLHEPEWPADHDRTWGGWSRVRGMLTPGLGDLRGAARRVSALADPVGQVVVRPERGAGAVGHAELAEHPAEVGLDGPLADAQPAADLLVGQALRDEPEHLELARAHRVLGAGAPASGSSTPATRGSSGTCPAAAARTAASRSPGSQSLSR